MKSVVMTNQMSKGLTCECGSNNLHDLDYIPAQLVVGAELDIAWADAYICEDCGSFVVREVEEQDLHEAEKEYVEVLLENDLIDKQKAQEILE